MESNFDALRSNISGVKLFPNAGYNKEDVFLSKMKGDTLPRKFDSLLKYCLLHIKDALEHDILSSDKLIVIISTTKGDLENGIDKAIERPIARLKHDFGLIHYPLVISNACSSGVIAINTAANLVKAGLYEYAIVIGIDLITDFVLFGFQSLFAMSNQICAPFDKNRNGISLGEACAMVVLSKNKEIFCTPPMEYLEGTSSNDANHISGPSRTGEGLYRTVKQTMQLAGITEKDIDFISAHGTATNFNDDMESIAFHRLNMSHIPVNSFKGYFGHTLGAAGVIETAICLKSMRENLLIKSLGYTEHGTSEPLNLLTENKAMPVNIVLKTASGFGGCNASLILKKS